MKRDVSIHAVVNGWVVRDGSAVRMQMIDASTDGTMKGTWVFNSTADLVRDLPAILETDAGPKPPVRDLSDAGLPGTSGIRDYREHKFTAVLPP